MMKPSLCLCCFALRANSFPQAQICSLTVANMLQQHYSGRWSRSNIWLGRLRPAIGDAERWLRSDQQERQSFFTPAKLRKAAQGKFRGKDYGYHCELGGHPVPKAGALLDDDTTIAQLLLADLLGHVGRIWDHLVGWARADQNGGPILKRGQAMSHQFGAWKSKDPMVDLPSPP